MVFCLGGGSGGGISSCVSNSLSDDRDGARAPGGRATSSDVITSDGKTAIEARLLRAGSGGGIPGSRKAAPAVCWDAEDHI